MFLINVHSRWGEFHPKKAFLGKQYLIILFIQKVSIKCRTGINSVAEIEAKIIEIPISWTITSFEVENTFLLNARNHFALGGRK